MKIDKKDIGEQIRDRLSDARIPLENDLWNRIDDSLDARDRRKRNIMLLWISGGAAAVLLFLLLLNVRGDSETDSENSPDREDKLVTRVDSILNASESNSEKTINYQQIESLVSKNPDTEGDNLVNSQDPDTLADEDAETSFSSEDLKRNNRNWEEEMTVKTIYHYYNSETKEVFETTDREVIDSLIENGNKETDSVKVFK